MLALTFLVLQQADWGKKEPQMTVPEVRALLVHLLDVREWDVDEILWWSQWRRDGIARPPPLIASGASPSSKARHAEIRQETLL